MKTTKFGETIKIRLFSNEFLFNQGDEGQCAYFINQGTLEVIVDGKKVGLMKEGNLFGEMALILNQNRSASIRAKSPSELVEIDKITFKKIFGNASIDLKLTIEKMCESLSRRNSNNNVISKSRLELLIQNEDPMVTSISRQIFHRLNNTLDQFV